MKVKFKKGNKIPYSQDFTFFEGIPSDVEFEVDPFCGLKVRLKAEGYGESRAYGNGAIYTLAKYIPFESSIGEDMIEINVTLHPHGDSSSPRKLGKMIIINDGSGTPTQGNYFFRLYTKRTEKTGRIENFPGKRKNVWYLVKEILNSTLEK